jgi:hypothetical protein
MDLQNDIHHILHGYKQVKSLLFMTADIWITKGMSDLFKQMMGRSWEEYVSGINSAVREKLSTKYGV